MDGVATTRPWVMAAGKALAEVVCRMAVGMKVRTCGCQSILDGTEADSIGQEARTGSNCKKARGS